MLFSTDKQRKSYRFFLLLILLLQVVALLLTNSRAAILGATVSSFFIIYMMKKKLFIKILVVLVFCTVSLFLLFPDLIEIIFVFFRGGRVLSNTRYLMWQIAYDIIKDNPIFGVGPGMFKFYIYKYIPVMLGSWDELQIRWLYEYAEFGHAHNFILFLTSEVGILGLVSALTLPILFFFYSGKTLKIYKSNNDIYNLIIGIIGLGIGIFVRSFFESTGLISYGWITRDLPFWIAFIIIIYLYQKSQNI